MGWHGRLKETKQVDQQEDRFVQGVMLRDLGSARGAGICTLLQRGCSSTKMVFYAFVLVQVLQQRAAPVHSPQLPSDVRALILEF